MRTSATCGAPCGSLLSSSVSRNSPSVVRASPARPDPTITKAVTSSAPTREIGSSRAGNATAHATVPRLSRTATTSSALCRASCRVIARVAAAWARQGNASVRKAVQGSQARGLYQRPLLLSEVTLVIVVIPLLT